MTQETADLIGKFLIAVVGSGKAVCLGFMMFKIATSIA